MNDQRQAVVTDYDHIPVEVSLDFIERSYDIISNLKKDMVYQKDILFDQLVKLRHECNLMMRNNEFASLDINYIKLNGLAEMYKRAKQKVDDLEYIEKCLNARKERYYATSYRI